MAEMLSVCVYDTEHYCNVLTRLSIEFEGDEHRSLIYGTLLPAYCASCPRLKRLNLKQEENQSEE